MERIEINIEGIAASICYEWLITSDLVPHPLMDCRPDCEFSEILDRLSAFRDCVDHNARILLSRWRSEAGASDASQ